MTNISENDNYITIYIDEIKHLVPKGYTIATAISYAVSLHYRKTMTGDQRGPFCNMGVCFECSVYLQGKGIVRACMLEVKEGMKVYTDVHDASITLNQHIEHQMTNNNSIMQEQKNDIAGDTFLSQSEISFENTTSSVKNRQVNDEHIMEKGKTITYDVAVIGAGPAGMAAVEEMSSANLQVVLIDEQEHIGGQIFRHIPEPFQVNKPHPLIDRLKQSNHFHLINGKTVWAIVPTNEYDSLSHSLEKKGLFSIYIEGHHRIRAKKVIIATGATDYVIPFKGWTKPGIMSAGGIQLFAKNQHYLPGKNTVLVGSHPFLLIVAKQIIDIGGTVSGIAFSSSIPSLNQLFSLGMNGLKLWNKSKELLAAISTIKRKKVPIWFQTVPVEAKGNELVTEIVLEKVNKYKTNNKNNRFIIPCDLVGVNYGFTPSIELARQLNCNIDYDETYGINHKVLVDKHMESSVQGVYVAGELTGVGGAELSEVEGRIAGLSLINAFQGNLSEEHLNKLNSLQRQKNHLHSFARLLRQVSEPNVNIVTLLKENPTTNVCRCEEISYQNIEKTLRNNKHITSLNSIKLLTRCGMGLCQGRYCENSLSQIAKDQLEETFIEDRFTERYPTKPITINDLEL